MPSDTIRPIARNFNWVVLLYKIVDLLNKICGFSNKIVDLFGKIVDLLFERGGLPHLENPPGYGPESIAYIHLYIYGCIVCIQ